MNFFSKISLKVQLITGFLLCALLTGFSGGVGVFSLSKIRSAMSRTTSEVTQNISFQNDQIQQLIPIRQMITKILDDINLEELDQIKSSISTLIMEADSSSKDIRQIITSTRELVEYKRNQVLTLNKLDFFQKKSIVTLENLTKLTIASVNNTVDDSIGAIEKEAALVQERFEKLLESKTFVSTNSIGDMMDETIMISEMSISSVRGAMNIQSKSNRQMVMINNIFNASDLISLQKAKDQIVRFTGRINSELVELPDDQTTKDITFQLKQFATYFDKMIQAKKKEIKAVEQLDNLARNITILVKRIENQVLKDGKLVSSNIISEMDLSAKRINKFQSIQVVFVIAAFILALAIGIIIAGLIIKPLNKAVDILGIAQKDGDLTIRLDDSSQNEMGRLGKWFNLFIKKLQSIIVDIAGNSAKLDASSKSLLSISRQMSDNATVMSEKFDSVESAAGSMSSNMSSITASVEQSSINIQMVSEAAKGMTATIEEIARNSEKTSGISHDSVDRTIKTSENIKHLSESAKEIGNVVETINDISEQINLLALNATIEAARAGEAGKGFAVVAGEIKNLAQQTAQATYTIKEKIENIQSSTKDAVSEVQEIGGAVNRVNEMVDTVAAAVEEQSATTKEIAENVSQVALGMEDISKSVSTSTAFADKITKDIANATLSSNRMSENSMHVSLNADDLSLLAQELKNRVDQFKV